MSQKTTVQTFGLFLALAGIVAVMPFVWSISQRASQRSGESRAGLEVGAALPSINGVGWINGPGPKADELKGKVVVVNAWAD